MNIDPKNWTVTLVVDSNITPTKLAIMVNMLPGVNDCYIAKSQLKQSNNKEE